MEGLWEAGLGFRLPKNTEGDAVREMEPARWVEPGLEGVCEGPAGLKEAAVGRNSEAFTLRLNFPEIAELGVCMLDLCGLVIPG